MTKYPEISMKCAVSGNPHHFTEDFCCKPLNLLDIIFSFKIVVFPKSPRIFNDLARGLYESIFWNGKIMFQHFSLHLGDLALSDLGLGLYEQWLTHLKGAT